ncbi:Crp/Fnr family transcriptional regulator [Acidobacteria bacterium AB60]|nr:Crp/Fnr family transcriptional regulator [Acidobacteria bacterium AB60]
MMTSPRLAEVRPFASSVSCLGDPTLSDRVVLMTGSTLFSGLSQAECRDIALCARPRLFARDELLFMQGQPIKSLVLIEAGSVKLTQLSPGGSEVILWMNGKGEAVGVQADAVSGSHTCSARAMEKSKALVWEYSRLQSVLTEHPQIRKNINQILSNRLQELEERFREIATERVAKRLALTLLRLMRQVGREQHGGIQISLSREELAQMTGTTLFTISRILSKWSEDGFIEPRRESVVIRDSQRLERQVDIEL